MDHGGQFEGDGRMMSQVSVGGVDLCDNLSKPEALAAQTRNLNETNKQTLSLSASQNEDEEEHRIIQNTSLNNNGKDEEEEVGKEGYTGRGREYDEEEDIDEVMKEAEEDEEEESEESSALLCCQSPDTPMTDSSYSETGSLLETPYPFSPGTSPEPTSPVIPVVSPGTLNSISPMELSQSDAEVDSHMSNSESVASITGSITVGDTPVDSTTLTITSDTSPPGPPCTTGTIDRMAKNAIFTTEHFTSSIEPIFSRGPTCTGSYAESQDSSRLNTSIASTTDPLTTGTESTSTTGPITSNWEHITSMSVSTCTTGPIQCTSPLKCLEQLAHKGNDTHFPQYLHQIAETFVLHEDYQWALWCIQLERLYHQRVLDNLNALQEQWESKCRTSSSLEIQHLDTLKHICLTHSRPGAGDAVCASLEVLRPAFEEGGASAHQVDGGMEQRTEDPSHSQSSHSVIPFINLADRFKSSEISEKEREDPDREIQGRDSYHGTQLTDKECSNSERGQAEDVGDTITVIGNGLHPPTAGRMDQSKPAEQQGGDLGLAQENEAKVEEKERDVEVAVEALEMTDEGDEEEDEKQKDRDPDFPQQAIPVETLVSGVEVGVKQLHQEAPAETKLHEDSQMSPASGLVSILKKRRVCVDNLSVSASSEPQPEKPTAKRRVRFKVPDDSYEQEVGGGDSCLLLFLLCLVTVVISVGGTALYCALGDVHSSVCQDFSRNADFYIGQIQRGITQIQHWFTPGS
ncbi:consortin isoform X2 [Anabas testudineus]|uniref:consortin isoform X2 n=1 Tax=Anabas testudineus TaxID=64144 RepID=UPI000E456C41|nr:consortin isoform X2 [Anabas testudineus]